MSKEKDLLRVGAVVKSLLVAGGIPESSVFALVLPEEAADRAENGYVVYEVKSGEIDYVKIPGAVSCTAYVTVMTWAKEYGDAIALAERCVDAIQEHRGNVAGDNIDAIQLQNTRDDFDRNNGGFFCKEMIFEIVL
ncbi:MAG: hypothetical protein LBB27_02940 [Tannerellaceae bacterium]|jgi:hypothetical protein|nr:hypothetical protein [Tannerellaceae bacterium]